MNRKQTPLDPKLLGKDKEPLVVRSANDCIIADYFRTTSGREPDQQSYRERCARSSDALARQLKGWLPHADQAALDLGCGRGELLYFLQQMGLTDLVGVNLCQEEIEDAHQKVKADFACEDVVEFLRNTERSFDWIGALNILEHLDHDAVLEALSLIASRLRPGGVLVAQVPNAISPFGCLTRHWDFTHQWAFTPNNFRQLAPLAGFDRHIEYRECGPVPHGLKSMVRYLLWRVLRLAIKGYLLIQVADTKGGVYTMDMFVRMFVSRTPTSAAEKQ